MRLHARSLLSRHRLPLTLGGVVFFFGVVLPACSPAGADLTPPDPSTLVTSIGVTPAATPIVLGGQSSTLSASVLNLSGAALPGATVAFARDTQYASIFSIGATSGVITAATVQPVAEVTLPVSVQGQVVVGSGYTAPPPVIKQITVRTRVASIAITGGGALALGSARQLAATPTIEPGSPIAPSPVMTWTSSNPTAVSVSSSGLVTAVEAATAPVTITATSEGRSGTADITISGIGNPLTITTTTLPDANVGASYSQSLASLGGPVGGVISWTLASGTLPSGITLGSNGTLTATNVTAAVAAYNFTVRVSSVIGAATVTTTKALSITVGAPPLFVYISPPGRFTVQNTNTQDFTLLQTDAAGNSSGTPPAVTWSSDTPTIANLVAPGRFRGVSTGGTLVRATTATGKVYTAAVTVGPRGAVRVSVSLLSSTGAPGDGALLEALSGSGVVGTGLAGENRLGVIPGLPPGTYTIRISKSGYTTQTIANVVVTVDVETNAGSVVLVP